MTRREEIINKYGDIEAFRKDITDYALGVRMTDQEFIKVWNDSQTIDEVAERTKYSRRYVQTRSSRLRSEGNDIKRFATSEYRAMIGAIGGSRKKKKDA